MKACVIVHSGASATPITSGQYQQLRFKQAKKTPLGVRGVRVIVVVANSVSV